VKQQGSEHKDLSDPSCSLADFQVQLTCGRLRWLCSVLAVAGLGLLGYQLTQKDPLEVYFPIHLKGRAAIWLLCLGSIARLLLAILNWKSWLKIKNSAATMNASDKK
jgi:hypothetical protein